MLSVRKNVFVNFANRHWLTCFGLLSWLGCPTLSWAAETASGYSIDYSAQLLKTLFALMLVIAAIVATTVILKRMQLPVLQQKGRSLQVVAALPLSAKEKILLVQAGQQQLLIGVTAQSIQTLHVFDTPVAEATETASSTVDFAGKLAQLMKRDRGDAAES